MSKCIAYSPQQNCKYQILAKSITDRAFEHCDYAKDKTERDYLLNEYRLAYGTGFSFKVIMLPKKYWSKVDKLVRG